MNALDLHNLYLDGYDLARRLFKLPEDLHDYNREHFAPEPFKHLVPGEILDVALAYGIEAVVESQFNPIICRSVGWGFANSGMCELARWLAEQGIKHPKAGIDLGRLLELYYYTKYGHNGGQWVTIREASDSLAQFLSKHVTGVLELGYSIYRPVIYVRLDRNNQAVPPTWCGFKVIKEFK